MRKELLNLFVLCSAGALAIRYGTESATTDGWRAVGLYVYTILWVALAVQAWQRLPARETPISITIKGVDPEKFELVRHDDVE